MNVLLLDANAERRGRIRDLIGLVGRDCAIDDAGSLVEAAGTPAGNACDVALVGPDLAGGAAAAVRRLRQVFPESRICAYGAYFVYDEGHLREVVGAGANMVFDERMAALKIALLLRPLFLREAGGGAMPSLLSA